MSEPDIIPATKCPLEPGAVRAAKRSAIATGKRASRRMELLPRVTLMDQATVRDR